MWASTFRSGEQGVGKLVGGWMRKCEALHHSPDCDGVGRTRDHFTPRCIARQIGWSPRLLNSKENIQYLSDACHRDKDRSTPRRLEQVKQQLNGRKLKLGDHFT